MNLKIIRHCKILKLDVNYQSPRREGPTRALEKAIRSGCDETVVGMLLDMGADPTLPDHYGHTPMDYVKKVPKGIKSFVQLSYCIHVNKMGLLKNA